MRKRHIPLAAGAALLAVLLLTLFTLNQYDKDLITPCRAKGVCINFFGTSCY